MKPGIAGEGDEDGMGGTRRRSAEPECDLIFQKSVGGGAFFRLSRPDLSLPRLVGLHSAFQHPIFLIESCHSDENSKGFELFDVFRELYFVHSQTRKNVFVDGEY